MKLNCDPKAGVFALSMGHCLCDFYNNFLPALLPVIMLKLDMTLTMCGLLVMVLSITANIIQPAIGYAIDKHDASRLLLAAVPLCGLFICFAGYAPNKPVLFLLCALLGVTVAAIHPLGTSLLGKVAPVKNMGRSMACYIVGGNIGFAAAPVAVMAFLEYYTLEDMPILAIPGLLLGIYYYTSGIYTLPTANAKAGNSPDAGNSGFISILKNKAVVKLNIAMGFRCWTHVAFTTFLPVHLVSLGHSHLTSGTLLSIFLMGSAAGGLCGGELGDRFQHKRLMFISLALAALPIYYFFQQPDLGWDNYAALFLAGAFLQAPQPSSIVWTGRLMPQYIGVASGMMMGFVFGIGSMGAAVTAAIGDIIGLNTAMLLSIIPTLIASVLTILTPYPGPEK